MQLVEYKVVRSCLKVLDFLGGHIWNLNLYTPPLTLKSKWKNFWIYAINSFFLSYMFIFEGFISYVADIRYFNLYIIIYFSIISNTY
jgi:hypothetical protein